MPRIWIVEDSPLEAEIVRRALSSVYRVEVFADGPSVIEQLANEPPPDAVVLDWRMPGMSGIEVCEFLRGRPSTQSIPILMLTVQHETPDLVRCLAAGADDFLAKGCDAAELCARVAALVRWKRMHERVMAAERAVRSLLMQLPEAVMCFDASGRLTFVNLEAQRVLGAEAPALVGKPVREILPGLPIEAMRPAGAEPVPLSDIFHGDRVFAPAIRVYAGIETTETTLSLRDVTTVRRREDERARLLAAEQRARVQAEEASRAKDEFLAVVSHELRTPLNAIVGWTRMLRTGQLGAESTAKALETIQRNAGAQQKLIEDILDVSRIISGKMHLASSTVDFAQIIRASVEACRLAAEVKPVGLMFEAVEGARVFGDTDRLQQIASNLISNAVKFTPRGGSISVLIDVDHEWVRLRVVDSGQGIEPDLLPHVFERFRQGNTGSNRSHGGLGLGLSIVRHLVELHGGTVAVESAGSGKGATFTVCLPLAPLGSAAGCEVFAPATAGARAAASDSLAGVRVLVVDDEADARDLLVAMFQQLSAEPLAVSSVAEAMASISTFRPSIVVSDIGMPDDDGYELIARLRLLPEGGATPAIALTAFAAPQDAARALGAGFSAYLAKPVDSDRLVAIVAMLCASG
ncbi:MAG TPA: response regulator [Polyangiaceae bacterium]